MKMSRFTLSALPPYGLFLAFTLSAFSLGEPQRRFAPRTPARIAENRIVATMHTFASPAGPLPRGWDAEILREVERQVPAYPGVTDAEIVARLDTLEEQLRQVYQYLTEERGLSVAELGKHIAQGETSFMRIRPGGPQAGARASWALERTIRNGQNRELGIADRIVLMRAKLGITDEQVDQLILRNFSAFHWPLPAFLDNINFLHQFLTTDEIRKNYLSSTFEFNLLDITQSEAVYQHLLQLGMREREVKDQTMRRGDLNVGYLFERLTASELEDLVERMLLKGLVADRETMNIRLRKNLFGFLSGPRVTQLDFGGTGLRHVRSLFADTAREGNSQLKALKGQGWDLQALNTVHGPTLIANYNTLNEYFANAVDLADFPPDHRPYHAWLDFKKMLMSGTRGAEGVFDGERILHCLSDIYPHAFRELLHEIKLLLNPREMDDFLHHDFASKVMVLRSLAHDLYRYLRDGTAIRRVLSENFAEVRGSTENLVAIIEREVKAGNTTSPILRDAVRQLSEKRYFSRKALQKLREVGVDLDGRTVLGRDPLVRALQAKGATSVLSRDRYALYCVDVLRAAGNQ